MRHHIDIGILLGRAVCDLYSNLVTRPTGAAVRHEIEIVLAGLESPRLTIIDFSQVGLLDFSCADEVIGKLLDGTRERGGSAETYVLVRGVREDHLEAIESAMERYDLAVIVERLDGTWHVVGRLDDLRRRVLDVVLSRGRAELADVAAEMDESPDAMQEALDGLWRHRLVMRDDSGYVSLQSAM